MLEFLAFLPIIAIIVLLVGFKLPSKKVLPISFGIAVILAAVFWQMGVVEIAAFSIMGALNSLNILIIIFGAVLLLNILAFSGGLNAISTSLGKISKDRRIQLILIGWCFVVFLEGAAGFGTPMALAAPILVALKFPPLAAVALTLIANSTANSFGAVGTPTLVQISILEPEVAAAGIANFASDLPFVVALIHLGTSLFVPLILVSVMVLAFGGKNRQGKWRSIVEMLPFALFAGAAFAIPSVITAYFLGPEMPSLFGGIFSLIIVGIAAKTGFLVPKSTWHFKERDKWPDDWKATEALREKREERSVGLLRAWSPYIIVSIILFVTRLPFLDLRELFRKASLSVTDIFGVSGASYTLEWLWLPGTVFIIVALMTILIHKMSRQMVKSAFKKTTKQVSGAVIALSFGVALVYLMMNSDVNNSGIIGMMDMIAQTLANIFGPLYIAVAPLIGSIGSFVSGSNTVSNMLFSTTQFRSAMILGMNPVLISALQTVGGSIGNIICIPNIVAASATVGLPEKAEVPVLKLGIIPVLILTTSAILTALGVGSLLGLL